MFSLNSSNIHPEVPGLHNDREGVTSIKASNVIPFNIHTFSNVIMCKVSLEQKPVVQ